MMKKLLIFDMDGTIADTDLLLVLSWVELYRLYAPKKKPHLEDILFFSGPPIRESLKKEFPHLSIEESFSSFCKISSSFYEQYLTSYPYCFMTLKEAKKRGYFLAVHTNKQHDLALKALHLLHMDNLFDAVIGGGDVSPKPNPEGIYRLLEQFSLKKEEVLYIGDTEYDAETAKNVGVSFVLCSWGSRRKKKDIAAEHFLTSYENFFDKLGL